MNSSWPVMQDHRDIPPQLIDTEDTDVAPPLLVPHDDEETTPKIPITLLTGFLGAGKSTLLEYILTANHGYKIAVCMNDFGDTTDIEASSMTLTSPTTSSSAPQTQFLSLPNGCLCCSIKEPGIAAIEDLVSKQEDKLDWVVVELTGVADPAEIAKSFWTNEELGGKLRLDAVVCVVDSRNVEKQLISGNDDLKRGNECRRQIATSDVILLNKIDLITSLQLPDIESTIRHINPTAPMIPTLRSAVPLERIYRVGAFSEEGADILTAQMRTNGFQQREDENDHEHGDDHTPHTGDIEAITLTVPLLSEEKYQRLETWLQRVLWEGKGLDGSAGGESEGEGSEVLRAKGMIYLDDGRRFVLQGVRDLFELKQLSNGQEGETVGKIVFIGKGMPSRRTIQEALEAALG